MGSYNMYKGVHCCHNDELINGILKGEWQWDGAIISDWGGIIADVTALVNKVLGKD